MKIFRKWRCKREDRGETPLHIGISMEINEVNWCWVPTTWERLAIWWPHVTPCQVSQKRPFWTFWPAKSSKTTFLRKIRRGNRARPSFSKTSFLDFLAREKLKNDVFEKNPQGESSPAKFLKNVLFGLFGPRKAQKRRFWENFLGRSSPNVLVCTEALPGEEPAWTGACNP